VPGLRRDEVARLAGVSTEYHTRLEQGRAGNPSPEVVEALARALQLMPPSASTWSICWPAGGRYGGRRSRRSGSAPACT
jgi:Predicted transcriptional regulators